jgi:glycine/D-amino acid oxidase-like deaminating enzyme
MIATETLAPELIAELIPNQRNLVDTRHLIVYYRVSPDRKRILFGGRVSLQETDPRSSAPALHREMTRIFPQLQTSKISHSWLGFIAFTFDTLPHLGQYQGIHYALGYCGSGIALSSYLGSRIGQQVLGLAEGATALDGLVLQTRPLYRGKPWFLAPSIQYYRWRDRLGV